MYKDLKVVWIFVVIVGIILIVSQCWQLHSLFQKAKENYIYKYKSVVEDAVVELSMLTHKDGYLGMTLKLKRYPICLMEREKIITSQMMLRCNGCPVDRCMMYGTRVCGHWRE